MSAGTAGLPGWRGVARALGAAAASLLAAAAVCAGASGVAHAAAVPWNERAVSYVSDRRPVKQVLKDVLATQPFPVVITGDIRGEVTGQFNEPADRILGKLAAAYGVVWFFDGSVLYLSSSSDIRSEVVELGALQPGDVEPLLTRLGLLEERFPVRVSRAGVLVSGPSRYVELVVKALRAEGQSLSSAGNAAQDRRTLPVAVQKRVRVFQLTHAQAGDVTQEVDGRREIIPGVATLLRRLGQTGEALQLDEPAELDAPEPGQAQAERLPGVLVTGRGLPRAAPRVAAGQPEARVEADVRTNSVIVHADKDLLDYYAEVIERLDQPRQLVQIDVTIMNVASSAVRDLGVALGVQHPRFSIASGAPVEQNGGLLFQGMVGTSASNLAVRIAALEQSGKIKVLSRPKLLALENIQAVLGSRSTAYVRVAGAYQADLFPVRAGLQVRMTPRIVSRSGEPANIHLALDIVDGYLQDGVRVDGIPVANERAIATQAVVGDGQTLLIGGHQYENVGEDQTGVPGLSRLPGIGGLFRRKRNSRELTEQLFLITPRLVSGGAADERTAAMGPARSPGARALPPGDGRFGGAMPLRMDDLPLPAVVTSAVADATAHPQPSSDARLNSGSHSSIDIDSSQGARSTIEASPRRSAPCCVKPAARAGNRCLDTANAPSGLGRTHLHGQ